MRIGALTGTVRIDQTKEKLAQYGAEAVFIEYETDAESKEALKKGDVDAILMSTIRCEDDYQIIARVNSTPLFFCTNKNRPELKAELDWAMDEIHLDSPYYEEQLDQKYYGNIKVQNALTSAERDYIASCGVITVALSSDMAPVEYYNHDSGTYVGIVPDVLALISERTGLAFNFVARGDISTLDEQMKNGEVQMIGGVVSKKAVDSPIKLTVTDPFYTNGFVLVVKDGSDVGEDGVMVLKSGYPLFTAIAKQYSYTNIKYADGFKACLDAVKAGNADYTLLPSSGAGLMLDHAYYSELEAYSLPNSSYDFGLGVSDYADPLLISILNKGISAIGDDQHAQLLADNISAASAGEVTLRDYLAKNQMELMVTLIVSALVIIAAIVWYVSKIDRLNRRLRAEVARADESSAAKSEFLSRMSHDMRTPMNGIMGIAYLAKDKNDPEELKADIAQIEQSGHLLLELINDTLNMSRIESGKTELHPVSCDEKQLFDTVLSVLQPQINEKKMNFSVEYIGINWKRLYVDKERLQQIFINIIGNAVKFTPEGGKIELIAECLEEREDAVRDRFIIRDNGCGMSEEFQKHMFEPFTQEHGGLTVTQTGTGLGLSIVKSIVDLMGGTISVRSKIGEGTEFTVILELAIATEDETGANPAEAVESTEPLSLRGKNILICEDNHINIIVAERLLEKAGCGVQTAENGEKCVEMITSSAPGTYDAILMDIRMPVMDGLEATKAIRALNRPDAKKIPIIAMSANAFDEDVKESLAAGMDAHLSKPIDPDKLYSTLAEYLS